MDPKKIKNLLILTGLLTVLGSAALWDFFKRKPKDEEKKEQAKKVFPITDQRVNSVTLSDGKKTFTFNCTAEADKKDVCRPQDQSDWKMTVPLQVPAERISIIALLKDAERLSSDQILEAQSDSPKGDAFLKEYGLDSQARATAKRLEIMLSDGTSYKTYFGNEHPFGSKIFVLTEKNGAVDESKVFVVPKHFASTFDKDQNHWRDKSLFSFATHQAKSFELRSSKGTTSGVKDLGRWLLAGRIRGDAEAIEGMINTVGTLKAKSIASENKASAEAKQFLATAKPTTSLKIGFEKDSLYVQFFKATPKKGETKIFAQTSQSPFLFELQNYSIESLEKSLADLRLSKLLTSVEKLGAKKLEFSSQALGENPMIVENKDSQWVLVTDPSKKIKAEKIEALLNQLQGKHIQEFLAAKTPPKNTQDQLKLVVKGSEGSSLSKEFLFWREKENLFARELGDIKQDTVRLDKQLNQNLPWKPDALFQ